MQKKQNAEPLRRFGVMAEQILTDSFFHTIFGDRCKRVSAQHQVAYCYRNSIRLSARSSVCDVANLRQNG
jgi:hypothetical protein